MLEIEAMEGWVSPRLQVCFGLSPSGQLLLYRPDDQPFETYEQIAARADQQQARAEAAEQEIERLKAQIRAWELSLRNKPSQRSEGFSQAV